MPIALAPFDPSRDFIAQTSFRAGGQIWLRKKAFDKSYVNERVLGQLYAARKIAYAADRQVEPAEPQIGEVELVDEPTEFDEIQAGETAGAGAEATSATVEAEAAVAPAEGAATAAAEPQDATTDKPQLDHDHDGKSGGSEPDNTGTREQLIARVADRHTHDELFRMASGIYGVKRAQTKAEIAAKLVDAGRVGDGTA